MKAIRVLLLVLVIMPVLVAGLVLAEVALGARAVVMNTDHYARLLGEHGFYEAVPVLVLDSLGPDFASLPTSERAEVEIALREALDAAWLKSRVEMILADISAFVRGKTSTLTAVIPLGQIKDRFLDRYAESASSRTVGELRRQLDLRDIAVSEFLPPGFGLEYLMDEMPPRLSWVSPLIPVAHLIIGALLVTALALSCLLAGGVRQGARWVAAAFVISGVAGVAASLGLKSVLSILVAGRVIAVPGLDALPMTDFLMSVVDWISATIRNHGLLFAAIGVGLVVLAGLPGRKRSAASPASESEAVSASSEA